MDFEPGIPDGAPVPTSDAFSKINKARNQWLAGKQQASDIDTSKWTTHEWLFFLNNMPETLSAQRLDELDAAFNLTASQNNEIAHSWLLIAVKNQYKPAYDRLYDYLTHIGRNKLVKPLYRELVKTDEGKAFARKAFAEARAGYHPLTIKANEGYMQ